MSAIGSGEKFRPLDFLRAIKADDKLDTHEFAVLTAAALGVDNETYKVRRTLAQLATDAKVHPRSVSRMLERPHVHRYVARIERPSRRVVNLWLRQEPTDPRGSRVPGSQSESDWESVTDESPRVTGSQSESDWESPDTDWESVSDGLGVTPSALSALSSARSAHDSGETSPFRRVMHEHDGEIVEDAGESEGETPLIRNGGTEQPSDDELQGLGWTVLPDRQEPTPQERRAMDGHERMLRDEGYTEPSPPVSGYRSRRMN